MPKYYLGPRNSVVMSVRWWCRSLGVGHRAQFSFFAMVLSWSPSAVLSLLRWPATRSCTRTPNYPKNLPCLFYICCQSHDGRSGLVANCAIKNSLNPIRGAYCALHPPPPTPDYSHVQQMHGKSPISSSHINQDFRFASAIACVSESMCLRKRAPPKAGAWRSQAPA